MVPVEKPGRKKQWCRIGVAWYNEDTDRMTLKIDPLIDFAQLKLLDSLHVFPVSEPPPKYGQDPALSDLGDDDIPF